MAIPFTLPVERDREDHHYLRIENLLKELLTLLRWTPWTSVTGVPIESSLTTNYNNNNNNSYRNNNTLATAATATANPTDVHHQRCGRRPRAAAGAQMDHRHRRITGHNHHRQQQPLSPQPPAPQSQLPDLITSCMPAATAAANECEKPDRTITLQVELCPKCYYDGRKLRVVGVTKMEKSSSDDEETDDDSQQSPTARIAADQPNHNDEQIPQQPTDEDGSKMKRRLLSLLQPSKIDSSILTAVFVIIGWKMFIKH